ncbi:MAG: VWA domain-containing protein [Candidatus Omnitrophota bacterium]
MIFRNPLILLLLPVVVFALIYSRGRGKGASLRFSSQEFLNIFKSSLKVKLSRNLIFFRAAAAVLILLALSRPQSPIEESKIQTEGVDIVLAVDASGSMLAEDFKLKNKRANRLEAVKEVVKDFIKMRKNDRIGLVAFAGRAYTVCPLTLDYGWLFKNLERVEIGMMEDGTAIGLGIASSLNRLKNTKAKGKVIILLTDGVNNAGQISPKISAEAAQALGIKVYTIGVGTKGLAPYPMRNPFGNVVYRQVETEIDEDTLKEIALKTEAKYYRATDTESLKKIYQEIDKLEKTSVEEKGYSDYKELFPIFLIPAVFLLFLEIILSNTILRKLP